jgi:hypothetical protein
MAAARALMANITTIVYGVSLEHQALMGWPELNPTPVDEVWEKAPRWIEVIGGVLEEECAALYG